MKRGKTTVGTARTEITGGTTYTVPIGFSNAVAANTPPGRPIYALPAWTRHGTQPDHWSETWLRKEKLADWDFVVGNTLEADDVEVMIRHLHEAAGAAE